MYSHKKHLILLALILVVIFSLSIVSYGEEFFSHESFHVKINDEEVSFTDELGHPKLTNTNRTMVPLRIISENMGYKVGWDSKEQVATVESGKTKIALKIGENVAFVNGKKVPIDVQDGKPVDTKAMLVPVKGSSRTYVPLRFISEAMGAEVKYERKDGVNYIEINTGEVEVQEEEKVDEVIGIKDAKVLVARSGDKNASKQYIELAKKYEFPFIALGPGHYLDYKQNQKSGFIEPVIQISDSYGDKWFALSIVNVQEYRGKGYEVKIESKYFKSTDWKSINYWGHGFAKEYGGKVGETLKYEISIRNENKTKTYPFVITLGDSEHIIE